jgi:ATP-binding cassette subfamily C exporter for protease/lipase
MPAPPSSASATNQPRPAADAATGSGRLSAALAELRGAFVTVAVFTGFLNLLMLAPSIYMLQVYDRVLASHNVATLALLTVLLLALYALMAAIESVRAWVLVRVGARLDARLHPIVFEASFRRSLQQSGSHAAQPMSDLNAVRQTLTGPGLIALFDAPWLPIYLAVIALLSPELAVFTVVGALLLGALALLNERLSKEPLDAAQRANGQAQNAMLNHLRNAEVIEALGMLSALRRRWLASHQQHLRLQAKASDRAGVITGLTKFVRLSMQSLALGYGALLVLEGRMTAGGMIAASILVSRALAPVEQLIGHWKQIIAGRSAHQRLHELLGAFPGSATGMPLPPPTGSLRLDAVTAGAPGGNVPILRGLSLAISAGDSVAVIGPSGSGKSTLARVMVGAWPVRAGVVRIDGADLHTWDREALGPHIGYLPQDIELFDGTVAENIARFGEMDANRVIAAARRVGMHEHILKLQEGYDTPIGAGGSVLSGGQRQRIGLARALYGDPRLVVLDEPNSNLDEQGERALADTLRELSAAGVTVVLVTHRLSLVSVAHKVLVLIEGSVKAYGPRAEVMAAMQASAAGAAPPAAASRPAVALSPPNGPLGSA